MPVCTGWFGSDCASAARMMIGMVEAGLPRLVSNIENGCFNLIESRAGIRDYEPVEPLGQQSPIDGADRPSLQRRDHVGAGHRRAVMERQAGAQYEVMPDHPH